MAEPLIEAKTILDSLVLLETVAARRQEQLRHLLHALISDQQMQMGELAAALGISVASLQSLLTGGAGRPVHDRIGISADSVDRVLSA